MSDKNYILSFKDGRKDRYITKEGARLIGEKLANDKGRFINIAMLDESGEVEEEMIAKTDVKGIRKRDLQNIPSEYKWVCDYGTRHVVEEDCECSKKFDNHTGGWVFDIIKKIYPRISYEADINKSMQEKVQEFIIESKP